MTPELPPSGRQASYLGLGRSSPRASPTASTDRRRHRHLAAEHARGGTGGSCSQSEKSVVLSFITVPSSKARRSLRRTGLRVVASSSQVMSCVPSPRREWQRDGHRAGRLAVDRRARGRGVEEGLRIVGVAQPEHHAVVGDGRIGVPDLVTCLSPRSVRITSVTAQYGPRPHTICRSPGWPSPRGGTCT